MPDPITNSTLGGAAQPALGAVLTKILIYIVGPVAASIVVMTMAQPKSPREWFSAIISTVMCSIGLGSYVISHYLNLQPLADELAGMQAGAIYFLCGARHFLYVGTLPADRHPRHPRKTTEP